VCDPSQCSSIDEDHNKALKIERLQSEAPPFRHSTLSASGARVQPSYTTVDQPPARRSANASTSPPATTTVIAAKSKENLYAMKPIPLVPKSTKEKKSKFIFIRRGEFFVESKETKQRFASGQRKGCFLY